MGGEIDHGIWDILAMTANIHADQNQLRSIVASHPILINGMAGSGKTAMLAKRGAIRIAFRLTIGKQVESRIKISRSGQLDTK